MPKRGPPPLPSATKKARGNPGKRPLPENEPDPTASTGTEVPEYLTDAAKKEWPAIVRQLVDANVLAVMDERALAKYCELHVQYIKARDAFNRHRTPVYTTHTGSLAIRPEWGLMLDCHDRMIKLLIEYGCTPASRTRVKTLPGSRGPGGKAKSGNKFDLDD